MKPVSIGRQHRRAIRAREKVVSERVLAHRRHLDRNAFFDDPGDGEAVAPDELAEMLAEHALIAATAGDAEFELPEEVGLFEYRDTFIETSGKLQFSFGDSDEGVEPAAFPIANASAEPDFDESDN